MLAARDRNYQPRTIHYLEADDYLKLGERVLVGFIQENMAGKLRVWRGKCPPNFLNRGPHADGATIDTLGVGLAEDVDPTMPSTVNFVTVTVAGHASKVFFRGISHGGSDAELHGVTEASTTVFGSIQDLLRELKLS